MGGKRIGSIFLWYLVCVVVISAEAADDVKNLNIWPMPKSVSYGYGNLHLSNDFELRTDGSKFVDASGILKDAFLRSLDVIRSTHVIELNTSKIDPSLVLKGIHVVVFSPSDELQHGIDESYKLHVPAQGRPLYAHIEAQTVYGALHGLETFSQVCHYNISSRGIVVHQVPWTVADQPRFSYRGLLIDTSRHYQPVPVIKKVIDSMTYAKLNVLHWHIVDTQSFPLEIPSYPKLWNGAYSISERYTYADAEDIVSYAKQRGINVLAEIDVPGHAESWALDIEIKENMKNDKEALLPSAIKNKEKRSAVHAKLKHQKKLEKKKKAKAREAAENRALELGEEPPARPVPRTIENTRELDETVCKPDDEELFAGNDADEFSCILKEERTPKVLITTSRFHSSRGPAFIQDLISVIPNAHYHKRGTYDLKKIVEYANKKDFTSIIVVHTNRREPDALLVVALPSGPTAHFKLSNLVVRKDIKNHGNPTSHQPELVLNNFTTRLGHRIGRLIQSLFPQDPHFRGRRVVTFHNQRDFVFFRHHRYIFETKEGKEAESRGKGKKDKEAQPEKVIARLQECGPRFTLKLISLQHGTFDTKGGEYEWTHKPEMDTSRRRFFL